MKKKHIITALLTAVLLVTAAVTAWAYSADSDPLITLSYLTEVFWPQAKEELAQNEQGSASSGSFQVIEMAKGQVLRAADGTLEVIVRPGSEGVVLSDIENGISDITDGVELYAGDSVPINHDCLIPRADSRGIEIVSEIAYLLVRGGYTIE